MDRDLDCLRCGNPLEHIKNEKLQLGQTGWFLGDLPNIISGALEVGIYSCKECKKIEFFQIEEESLEDQIAQNKCPNCGNIHDIDYPKCPYCKYDYYIE